MPSRVIRDGLLESERYWAVSIEARQLFLHLILLADDFGLVDVDPSFARRRCYGSELPPVSKVTRWLDELHRSNLVRVYFHDGRRFGFIPNFRQRLKIKKARHPLPPADVYADDKDAAALFRENSGLFQKKADGRRQHGGDVAPSGQADVPVPLEMNRKDSESMPTNGKGTATAAQQERPNGLKAWAEANGIKQQANESSEDFSRRAGAAWSASLRTAHA